MMSSTFINPKVPYFLRKEINLGVVEDHLSDFDEVAVELEYDGCPSLEPLVSIVIPCYHTDLLEVALKSAVCQEFEHPYEIVVVNDNIENKREVERIVLSFNSSLIRLFQNKENIGLFGNWNRCIILARADYLVYLHDDDALVPDTLSKLWAVHLQIDKRSAVIGRYVTLNEKNQVIYNFEKTRRLLLKSCDFYRISKYGLLFGDLCNGCGALLCKQAMLELGGWNPDYFPASDRILFLNYADHFGLFRVNEIVRRETYAISTSSLLYKKYPSISYYLSRAVIIKYFKLKPLWHFFNYHAYIVYNNTKSLWETDSVEHKHIPRFSRIIDFVYKFPYRLLGGKRFLFS